MDKIIVHNIFAAVSDKTILDPLLQILDSKSIQFWGTEGTVKYLKSKGFSAFSVVAGFDFDGRVKSLDRVIFARILADRTNLKHLKELKRLKLARDTSENTPGVGSPRRFTLKGSDSDSSELIVEDPGVRSWESFDLVIVDLYKPDPNNFPESMDIGGQALIRAAVKNYRCVALAFDVRSLGGLVSKLARNGGSTTLFFRQKQAKGALKFIAERCKLEANLELFFS